jgi:YegS/Rv2252/BmrU family lipid kinase
MEENRWGIIYCPKAGHFPSASKRWEKIEKCLKDNNISYDYVQSERMGSVDRLVKMFIQNGYHTIVIVGGDSALNDAVNCLMQTEKSVRDQIALGVVPNGVMNDFAHFWEFQEDNYEQTIAWLKKRRVRKIDLGCIRYTNARGEMCRRYFLNCINIGLIAAIMNMRRRTRHLLGSRALSFFFSFLMMTFQRLDYKMHLRINDDEIKRRVMTVCIGNATGYGQTPNAVPYNGLLDVSVVYHPGITQLFEGFYLFLKGKFLNHRSVHPYRTRKVVVERAEHALVGIDGRLMHTPVGPFTVTVEQEVINFLIPE